MRLLCPWDFPGDNAGVGCHFLLQGIFPTQGLNLGLLHCQAGSLLLSCQGGPYVWLCISSFIRKASGRSPSSRSLTGWLEMDSYTEYEQGHLLRPL